MQLRRPMTSRWRWGLKWGGVMAMFYCVIGGIAWLITGARAMISLPVLLALYAIGGVGGGLILALLKPLTGTWWGAAFAGFVIAFTVWGLFGIRHIEAFGSLTVHLLVSAVLALVTGAPIGVWIWADDKRN